jgi:hypothetical protein
MHDHNNEGNSNQVNDQTVIGHFDRDLSHEFLHVLLSDFLPGRSGLLIFWHCNGFSIPKFQLVLD